MTIRWLSTLRTDGMRDWQFYSKDNLELDDAIKEITRLYPQWKIIKLELIEYD